MAMEVVDQDEILFADLNKQISLLIMDDDTDHLQYPPATYQVCIIPQLIYKVLWSIYKHLDRVKCNILCRYILELFSQWSGSQHKCLVMSKAKEQEFLYLRVRHSAEERASKENWTQIITLQHQRILESLRTQQACSFFLKDLSTICFPIITHLTVLLTIKEFKHYTQMGVTVLM